MLEPQKNPAIYRDEYHFVEVFSQSVEQNIKFGMHPEQALRAAIHAVDGYAKGFEFKDFSHKQSGGPVWKMFPKRPGGAMK
jgi:hypothetical protein